MIEPGTPFMSGWHIDCVCEYLEAVSAGQILRLLINMPPRYGKSNTVTVMWPVWTWITDPESRWLFTSYSETLAVKHSLDRRRILESDWYRKRWGDVFRIASDQNQKHEYENSRRGVMVSVGMQGSATGKGGNYIIIDDPHNPKRAESDLERETAKRDFRQTFSTRLDDKHTGAIVVVMQRLHEADISADCLEMGYTHLCLPAESEHRTVVLLPVSGREIVREPGDLLWPEREGPQELAQMKTALGSYGYSGQYQQDPSPSEGGVLKKHWWKFWYHEGQPLPPVVHRLPDGTVWQCGMKPLPKSFYQQLQSWDMTFKDTAGTDFVVGQVWGQSNELADFYLLDQTRDRMDMPKTLEAVRWLTREWPLARLKLIEDKANGSAVIAMLRNQISGLVAVNPEGGKASRVNAVAPTVEAGNVYLPHPHIAPWVSGFIEECGRFPMGANDDMVDSFTQALTRMLPASVGVF